MWKTCALGFSLLLAASAPAFAEPAAGGQRVSATADALVPGRPAGGAPGDALAGRIEARWAGVMRKAYGWDEHALRQFREGYRDYPAEVLEEALVAGTFERMQSVLDAHAALRARDAMAKAHPARARHALNALAPDDAANEQLMEARRLAAKALGDDTRDLVFVPVAPCTVWDTRFASGEPFGPAIGNGVTRRFYSHLDGAGGNFTVFGGNAGCAEANQDFIGDRPFAVMMVVYVNNPAGNGWLTFYRDGDPDPSQATISVYYSPGPTRTQTVITKSGRGYGAGAYDVAVTGRFSTAHASASVVGYFIKPQATGLDCRTVDVFGPNVAWDSGITTRVFAINACPATYRQTGVTCGYRFPETGVYLKGINQSGCHFSNNTQVSLTTADLRVTFTCCRVPGR